MKQKRSPIYQTEYNVDDINGNTESDSFGEFGVPYSLLPGLAESLMKFCEEPDVVVRRIVRDNGWKDENDSSDWHVDETLSVSIYYPGNSNQTCFASVEKYEDGEVISDYYQLPYCEIVPRLRMMFKIREDDPTERLFISHVNNAQLAGWFFEAGLTCMSEKTLKLLENKQHEIIRNEDGGGVEPEQKTTND